jgi:hypothetical protein
MSGLGRSPQHRSEVLGTCMRYLRGQHDVPPSSQRRSEHSAHEVASTSAMLRGGNRASSTREPRSRPRAVWGRVVGTLCVGAEPTKPPARGKRPGRQWMCRVFQKYGPQRRRTAEAIVDLPDPSGPTITTMRPVGCRSLPARRSNERRTRIAARLGVRILRTRNKRNTFHTPSWVSRPGEPTCLPLPSLRPRLLETARRYPDRS